MNSDSWAVTEYPISRLSGNNGWYFYVPSVNQYPTIRTYNGTSQDGESVKTTALDANTWYHICWTIDDTVALTVYLDGVAGTTDTSFGPITALGDLNIGRAWFADFFDGAIDQVTIWDYDIGADGVLEAYNGGIGRFFAAVWDTFFDTPYFAWSQKPTYRRLS
jgi:hypothetical protein